MVLEVAYKHRSDEEGVIPWMARKIPTNVSRSFTDAVQQLQLGPYTHLRNGVFFVCFLSVFQPSSFSSCNITPGPRRVSILAVDVCQGGQ